MSAVAPGMAIPSRSHWKVGAGIPAAAKLNTTPVRLRGVAAGEKRKGGRNRDYGKVSPTCPMTLALIERAGLTDTMIVSAAVAVPFAPVVEIGTWKMPGTAGRYCS